MVGTKFKFFKGWPNLIHTKIGVCLFVCLFVYLFAWSLWPSLDLPWTMGPPTELFSTSRKPSNRGPLTTNYSSLHSKSLILMKSPEILGDNLGCHTLDAGAIYSKREYLRHETSMRFEVALEGVCLLIEKCSRFSCMEFHSGHHLDFLKIDYQK